MIAHCKQISACGLKFMQDIYGCTKTVNRVLGINNAAVYGIILKKTGHHRLERPAAGITDHIAYKTNLHSNTPILFILLKYNTRFK